MSETALTKSKRKTAADYEIIASQMLAEIDRLEEQMNRDRAESERLKAETQIIKAHTDATLSLSYRSKSTGFQRRSSVDCRPQASRKAKTRRRSCLRQNSRLQAINPRRGCVLRWARRRCRA